MPADISAAVPRAPIIQNTINEANIDTYQAAIATYFNNNNLGYAPGNFPAAVARGAALAGGNAYTAGTLADLWMQMAVIFANNGTSKATKYPNYDLTLIGQGTALGEHVNVRHIIELMGNYNITAREFARCYADRIFNYGKDNSIEWRVGKKNGIDQKYGYCGFDFAEYANGLNTHERAAADSTTQIALSRASGSSVRVNNAAENTKGVINNPPRTLMF